MARWPTRRSRACCAGSTISASGPDWWKLEPQATRTAWQHVGDEIRARDPFCRGVVLLGLEASEDALDQAFQTAASDPIVKGFAVGRTIFAEPADAWLRGQIDDAGAVAEMAGALLAPDRCLEKGQARQLGGGLILSMPTRSRLGATS